MPVLEIIGWVGSAVVVWSMMQQRILRLRVINLVGCLIQVVYNGVLEVWPVVALNVVLAGVQIFNLYRLLRTRHSPAEYGVLRVDPAGEYLHHLLALHRADIQRFTPSYREASPQQEAYLIVRGEETVGYVLLHDAGDGVAQVDLDYVIEKYRNFTPGEFVFHSSDVLREAGYRKVVTAPRMRKPYYAKIGFTQAGDRYELALTS
ncbi:YgjV family protein [Georgenia yuyongxinii]|uniref:YgjV family protein n=1 Tax=Georgenia yuyongxinii TaxID=2589797 RepID=A0A5B8C5Q6_9MICO|nr:YgjV family protein [Georgenia yuyongxinii]QDC24685.1 YgjV family protein [Georgenia yuyongxinii]